jgi:hypothetical protein
MAVRCAYHPDADAAGACVNCGRLICTECKVELSGKIYCNPCIERMLLDKTATQPAKPEPVAAIISTPSTAPTRPKKDTTSTSMENTSGQGKSAAVPQEIKRWSWGAFLLNWIWGIGNSVWIALISLIPIPLIGLIMMFVLGAKGNEWAWQSKKWDSVEHFKKTQRTWAIVGVVLFCISILAAIIIGIISVIIGGINIHVPYST